VRKVSNGKVVRLEDVKGKIIELRGEKVILDSDVARLYGVKTKRVNEAVKNNTEKFPAGYIIKLDKNEWNFLKSKFSTSIKGGKVKLPKAFTEKGLYMLATILKSKRATKTTLAIIEAFSKLRNISRNIRELSQVRDKNTQKEIMKRSGKLIAEILDDELDIIGSETTIELNFAVLKFKHTVRKKKNKKRGW